MRFPHNDKFDAQVRASEERIANWFAENRKVTDTFYELLDFTKKLSLVCESNCRLTFSIFILVFVTSCASIEFANIDHNSTKVSLSESSSLSLAIPYLTYSTKPVDLDEECKRLGWQKIRLDNDFLNGFVVPVVTLGYINSQRVRLTCTK